jgi:hypothetical protein
MVMSIVYGRKGTLVTQDMVQSVTLVGTTITAQDNTNGYSVTVRHDTGDGCQSSGFTINIHNWINWKFVSAEFLVSGSAACWSFMQASGYGQGGNLYDYDEAQGDRCVKTYLAQDMPEFASHAKANACDNDTNNFMRYNTGTYRRCTFIRRRNMNGQTGGVGHGRACSSVGGGSVTIVKNIFVWV